MDYRDPDWVAERLGVDKNTVYKFLQDGTIPAIQLGRKWLVSEGQLEQWLREEAARQTQARREAAASAERTARRMENFTPEAREAIRSAHSEARRYGHTYLGQEHLLLGLAMNPECPAARVLRDCGVSAEQVRAGFEAKIAPGQAPAPRRLGRTERAKKAMRLGMKEARKLKAERVGSEHLLLGIVLAGEGAGWEMLNGLGIGEQALRKVIGE